MNLNCAICGEAVDSDKHYYQAHKIKMADYFVKYFPRRDQYTQENIPFKSKESYFSTDFINKNNLKKYLRDSTEEEARQYCENFLIKRKKAKNLKYAPSQTELRSLTAPSIITYKKFFPEGYRALCERLGFITKYTDCVAFPQGDYPLINVTIDTREQTPLRFPKNPNLNIAKLDYGDYCLESNDFKIFFERKSLNDLIGTCSKGLERFKKEILRAQDNGDHLIVVVETNISKVMSFNFLPQCKFIKNISPDYLMHNIRDLIQEFPNLQFVFPDNRQRALEVINTIFQSGEAYKEIDLQLCYDLKLI